jgi:peptidoglycan LD-endopeptidase LytH
MSRIAWLGMGAGVLGVGAWFLRRARAEIARGASPAGQGAPLGITPISPPPALERLREEGWVWPVPRFEDGRAPRISDGWGSARDGGRRRHRGVDVMYRRANERELVERFAPGTPNGSPLHFMPDGTPALAARGGVVRWVKKTRRGFEVVIGHNPAWATYYQHLERPWVRVGELVVAGQAIGVIGGNPLDGAGLKHLHFELWSGGRSDGAIDPKPVMASWKVLARPREPQNARRAERIAKSTKTTQPAAGAVETPAARERTRS